MKINREIVDSITETAVRLRDMPDSRAVLISFDELYSRLEPEEVAFIKSFLKLRPEEFGFKGPFQGFQEPGPDLVPIRDQKYFWHRKEHIIGTQYTTPPLWEAYQKLLPEIERVLGKKLLIDNAYRSPAYQACTFIYYLQRYDYDPVQTAKRVALPGYSEHGSLTTPCLDFITENGIPSDDHPYNFARTPEYRWLQRNASQFCLVESYPRNNTLGVNFEPWHWRLET